MQGSAACRCPRGAPGLKALPSGALSTTPATSPPGMAGSLGPATLSSRAPKPWRSCKHGREGGNGGCENRGCRYEQQPR